MRAWLLRQAGEHRLEQPQLGVVTASVCSGHDWMPEPEYWFGVTNKLWQMGEFTGTESVSTEAWLYMCLYIIYFLRNRKIHIYHIYDTGCFSNFLKYTKSRASFQGPCLPMLQSQLFSIVFNTEFLAHECDNTMNPGTHIVVLSFKKAWCNRSVLPSKLRQTFIARKRGHRKTDW